MRLTLILLVIFIWDYNKIFPFGLQSVATTTKEAEVNDLQDGHPNHRLWQKMIDAGRSPNSDWYVNNLDLFYNLFFILCSYLSILSFIV